MKRAYIFIAIVIAALIAVTVLQRDFVASIFAPSETEQAEQSAEAQIKSAKSAYDKALEDLGVLEAELETQQNLVDKAEADWQQAQERLAALQANPEIDTAELEAALAGEDTRPVVEVLKSEAQEISNGIFLSGKAEAARKLEVRAETSGQVISEPLPSGTLVKDGDVLCELDPGSRQAALDQARASLDTAQTQFNSTKSLNERNLASTAALQNATAQLEQAQSAVENAEREIGRLKIVAPFDGILEVQSAELGSLLQPGSVCASIIGLDRLHLVGYAAESQIDKIELGSKATGELRDGKILHGEVSFIASTADPATRTYRVEVNVPNNDNIRDGASTRIEIALAGSKGHLLPQNAATLNAEGELGVRVHKEGKVEFLPATLVRDTPEGMWLAGLPDYAEVIVTGQEYVSEGEEIIPSYREAK